MRNRAKVGVLTGFAVILALGTLLRVAMRPHEPAYAGHPLRYWLEATDTGGPKESEANRERARHALQQMGTNALPCLLAWISYDEAAWKTIPMDFLSNLRYKALGRWIPRSLAEDHARHRAESASYAFSLLGDAALPAIPQLTRLAKDPAHAARACRAIETLAHRIGTGAVPALANILTNGPPFSRRALMRVLPNLVDTNVGLTLR